MRIRRGDIVRIKQDFIEKYKRDDYSSTIDYVVKHVYAIGGGHYVASIQNTETGGFHDVCTYNLIKIEKDGKDSSL